jgi:hypothetical protein
MPKTRTTQPGALAIEANRLTELRTHLELVRAAVGSKSMLARLLDLHLVRAEHRVRDVEQRLRAIAKARSKA